MTLLQDINNYLSSLRVSLSHTIFACSVYCTGNSNVLLISSGVILLSGYKTPISRCMDVQNV